jgi:DNA-binding SARP family transcriptional activator
MILHQNMTAELHLFAEPHVIIEGRRTELRQGSQRLLVYLAVLGGRIDRRVAAGGLWPIGNDERAGGNLRTALWRLRASGIDLVEGDRCSVWLRPSTVIDLRVVSGWAARLIEGRAGADDLVPARWSTGGMDLLPGWYDDWVIIERERFRQRLLHGLEALSRYLAQDGRHAEAVEVAMTTVAADPLRESAQRVLVEAHLAEGNVVEARRAYGVYRDVLARQLQVRPGAALTSLVWPSQVDAERQPGRSPTLCRCSA